MVKVKICGLKKVQDIEIVNNLRPDYIGSVLAPSKRQINLEIAKHLKSLLHPSIKSVGVFGNEPLESVLRYEEEDVMDRIQLHGDEDIVYLKKLKKASKLPIIKAFRIKSGDCFNWQILKKICRPYFLAGGIGIENVQEALQYTPYAIDVSSKVEKDGVKDAYKIKELIEKLRN